MTSSPRRTLALIFAFALLAPATLRAQASFDEHFDELGSGVLDGKGGWAAHGIVNVVPGPAPLTSLCANGQTLSGIAEAGNILPVPFLYTAADTAVVWSCRAFMRAATTNRSALAGPSGFTSDNGDVFGLDGYQRNNHYVVITRLSAVEANEGDVVTPDHWYEIRVVANFKVASGLATLSYRDLTLGESAFHTDSTLRNVHLGAIADAGGHYTYRSVYLRVDDQEGGRSYIDDVHVGAPGSSVAGVEADRVADAARFLAVGPNPVGVSGVLRATFALPRSAHVRATAFDAAGRAIRVLADGPFDAGAHTLAWDLRDASGRDVAPGAYYLRLEANGRAIETRVTRVR